MESFKKAYVHSDGTEEAIDDLWLTLINESVFHDKVTNSLANLNWQLSDPYADKEQCFKNYRRKVYLTIKSLNRSYWDSQYQHLTSYICMEALVYYSNNEEVSFHKPVKEIFNMAPDWYIDQHKIVANYLYGPLAPLAALPETQPVLIKEKEVKSDNNFKVEHITFIGGRPAKDMTDDEVFDAIHAIEGQIKHLESVENKPNKLIAKIDELKQGIKDLVSFIDSRL